MPIKSFRGKIANNGNETVVLHTNNGNTGYRIKKFEIMANTPGAASTELVCKIYTIPQSAVDGVVDFSDQTLIGVALFENDSGVGAGPMTAIIFDNITFNQDIYLTAIDVAGSQETNYHIELEQVKLDLNQNTVATLKDIKNIEQRSQI